jgi:hypothetical protein
MRKHRGWAISAGLVVLAVVAVFVAGAVAPGGASQARAADPIVLEVDHNGTAVKSYTQSQIESLGAYTGYAGIQNSGGVVTGPDPVTGVSLSTVLQDALGGTAMASQQSVDVVGSDGYPQSLTYDQVVNPTPSDWVMYNATTGAQVSSVNGQLTCVLAWSRNGLPLPSTELPLRLYCADSMMNDLGGQNVVMRGSDSVSSVVKLNLRDQTLAPWQLKLVGLKVNGQKPSDVIDAQSYQSCAAPGCHGTTWTSSVGQSWSGVPLYLLMGEVDGGKDMTYNAKLARAGYRIRLYNAAGTYVTLSSTVTVNRSSIVVANSNGGALGTKYYPLRLVGPVKWVPQAKRLGTITRIVMLPRLRP